MPTVCPRLLPLVAGVLILASFGERADADPCAPFIATAANPYSLQSLIDRVCRRGTPVAARSAADPEALTIRVGGWFNASYRDNDFPRDGDSVAVNHVNIHVDTRYRDWQLFLEGEYEDIPDLINGDREREFELQQGFFRIPLGENLSLRGGRHNTPFGYWNPIHWTIAADTISRPIHVRNYEVPEQQLGIALEGRSRFLSDLRRSLELDLEYTFYASYNPSGFDIEPAGGQAGGADFRLVFSDRHFLGLSGNVQRNDEHSDDRETGLMAYGEWSLPYGFTVRSEYLRQWRENASRHGIEKTISIWYAKVRWSFSRYAYLNYRFDFGEDEEQFDFAVDRRVHTLTLGFQPVPRVRLRVEYEHHDFLHGLAADYNGWAIWLGVLF